MELLKKIARHVFVVMLPGVHKPKIYGYPIPLLFLDCMHQGRNFHKVGPSTGYKCKKRHSKIE
jgi:hypothetical protein